MYDSDPKTDARIINAQQTEGARDKMDKINELDEWLEQQACTFNQGKGRAYNREYQKLYSRYQTALYRARELKEMGETAKAGELALKFAWERLYRRPPAPPHPATDTPVDPNRRGNPPALHPGTARRE